MRLRPLLILALGIAALPARADVPISLGVNAGAELDAGPWRAAPSLSFQMGVGLGTSRFALIGRLDGWTFASTGVLPANSELTAAIGAQYTQPIAKGFFFSAAVAPSLSFLSRPGVSLAYEPGLMVIPAFGIATRRRTLALEIGAQGLATLSGEYRVGALAGVVYTFQ